ncbi:RNA polymerase sigma factor [Chitinophagaceae bacterium MMS25-I14]
MIFKHYLLIRRTGGYAACSSFIVVPVKKGAIYYRLLYGIFLFYHLYINSLLLPSNQQHINLTDEELLSLYRSSNDAQWLGYLLQRYTLLLLGVAMKYLKDREEAQDAVQQVFLKAITHLPQGEILNFKGWLYVLMRNYCLQLLRDQQYKAPEEVLGNIAATHTDNEEVRWQEYTLEQMKIALEELNEEQKNCVVLFYLEKKSYQQITDQTGFDFRQVKSYIQNGKRNLKNILLKKLGKNSS